MRGPWWKPGCTSWVPCSRWTTTPWRWGALYTMRLAAITSRLFVMLALPGAVLFEGQCKSEEFCHSL